MSLHQQRRRRIWPEETAVVDPDAPSPAPVGRSSRSKSPAETYTAQARRDEQTRLIDLIPVRYRALTAIYSLGLLIIAMWELAYLRIDYFARQLPLKSLAAFDLTNRASFAAWWSSFMLLGTAGAAALIYSLRRHRIDDYRGRYRLWSWVILGWLGLAINQTAQLDDLVRTSVVQLADRAGITGDWCWPAVCGFVTLLAIGRLSFEMRRSPGTLVLLWLGTGSWFAANCANQLGLSLADPQMETMLTAGLRMLGQLTLLTAHTVYARHVLLDAHGLLRRRAKSTTASGRKTQKAAETSTAESGNATRITLRTDLDSSTTPSTNRVTSSSKIADSATEDESDDEDDSAAYEGLTRTERKRLRRERRQQRRNSAA